MKFLTGAIDSEGAEYATIAAHLLGGNGYVGGITAGPELMFPPLFPLLIAMVSTVTHSPEISGRLISVMMGTFLVAPIYFITLCLFNRAAASISALLVACHPLLIAYSATVFVETTFMTLAVTGIYCSIFAWIRQYRPAFALAGMFFGLAYLARQEAALYPLLISLLLCAEVVLWHRQNLRQTLSNCGLLLVPFVIVASPYVAWLSAETGQFRWEGKTPINYAATMAKNAGMSRAQLWFGIDQDMAGTGIAMQSNLSIVKSVQFRPMEMIPIALANGIRNSRAVVKIILIEPAFGSPILFGLAAIGLSMGPWNRKWLVSQGILFIPPLVSCLALLSIDYVTIRYCLLFLPVLIVWASNGVMPLAVRVCNIVRGAGRGLPRGSSAERVCGAAIMVGLLLVALAGTVQVASAFDYRTRPAKTAGEWLRHFDSDPMTVMDASTMVAFHAGAAWVPFPFADPSLALKYADKRKVDFIVLRAGWPSEVPYWQDWFKNGIPDPRAQLVYSSGEGDEKLLIYKWNRAARGFRSLP